MSRKTFDYDVFLSHSSHDQPVVRDLAERLEEDGLRVWFDEWEIRPGDSIPLRIEQGLEASRTLILCMSPRAFASDWVALERHTALFRDPSNAERRFIPLLLENCEIPDVLRQFRRVDWRKKESDQYTLLLNTCRPLYLETPQRETAALPQLYKEISLGHKDSVWSVALSGDGRLALSGSKDKTVRVWDVPGSRCLIILEGHTRSVNSVALSGDGRLALSGSDDMSIRIWDVESARCLSMLKGHTASVVSVALSGDNCLALSGSLDKTVRVWDLATERCIATLEGHTSSVYGVAVSGDGRLALSGSLDKTVRVWDLATGRCTTTLEGHTDSIDSVVLSGDGCLALSGSRDKTVRVWDVPGGRCLATLEGHTAPIYGVALSRDSRLVISAAKDGEIRFWNMPEVEALAGISPKESTRYANAKVVLAGESGVGKTGLALRLCEDRWEPTESTHGMIVSPLKLPRAKDKTDIEREVWLWDFAGQPDYRLIHQLYMDETALGLLVFDPQDDNPFEDLGHWEKALHAAAKHKPEKLLVAARSDRGGITISKQRFEKFVKEHGFAGFLTTGAKTGEGCQELMAAIARHIPWDRLPYTSTTKQFKAFKDAIIALQEEKAPLIRLPELRQRLQLMLPGEIIGESELRTVIGLLQGQGVIQMLAFGDVVLLQPEWINRYASVVVRMARESTDEMGIVPEQQVLDGRLEYKDMKRMSGGDEKILLRAMVQTFLDRALCLREHTPKGTMLVFPSYFRRDRPDIPEHPHVFVTYGFSGPLDVIYSTLVVKLSYSEEFKKDQLWKNAADFKTHGGKRVGLLMTLKTEGAAEIIVYFDSGVDEDTKVTFVKYIHEHLLARAQDVTRVRHYVCPHCDTPLENRKAIAKRISAGKHDILCGLCEKRVNLYDLLEQKFASDEFLRRVREMDERATINLDNESLELILIGHAFEIAGEAGQIFRPIANSDWGIDGEIEFKNDKGEASGQRVYLQLKHGDSYLRKRQRDEKEIFTIKNPRHAEYWQSHAYPVMLVIRTSDGRIRWMNVTDYLKKHGKETKQIIFDGEPFTMSTLLKLRDQLFSEPKP